MKNAILVTMLILSASVSQAQDRVRYMNPVTNLGQFHTRQMQGLAEEVFAEQDRQRDAFVQSVEIREFQTADKKNRFSGKFLALENGKARILHGEYSYLVAMSKFSSADQKWIREEVRRRKGLKVKPEKAVVEKETVSSKKN